MERIKEGCKRAGRGVYEGWKRGVRGERGVGRGSEEVC